MKNAGVTLIELLIVLAIAAVLAAIAAPNFEAAWIRSKVSQTRADMRSMRIALEAYRVDYKEYSSTFGNRIYATSWMPLTTPVAYMATIPRVQFPGSSWNGIVYNYYDYWTGFGSSQVNAYLRKHAYAFDAGGPSYTHRFNQLDVWQFVGDTSVTITEAPSLWLHLYDPSNGIISSGDFVATQKKQYN